MSVTSAIKAAVPPTLKRQYHHLLAILANLLSGRPSRHLIVIGVTGTDGKTTTTTMIAEILAATGAKVGLSSSVWDQIADRRWLNETHMTMPGRFGLQKLLKQMVGTGCRYAVVEVSSEGLAQHRHTGIDFDIAVLTNLTPEHIEAHGSFDKYRQAKGLLFSSIIRGGDKKPNGQHVPKITVVNLDDPSHDYFLKFWAESHYGTSLRGHEPEQLPTGDKLTVLAAQKIITTPSGSDFKIDDQTFTLPLPGEHNIRNALQAIAVARGLGVDWSVIKTGLTRMKTVPGRGEEIITNQPWRVIVDYALTPAALAQLYKTLKQSGAARIIAVFGAAGGGRDVWKRPELGQIAASYCDKIILTTDDPYDEPPAAIAAAIAAGIPHDQQGKVTVELDRRAAIALAMKSAQPGDVIAITGMGAETSMMVGGNKIPWSDAGVAKEELLKII